MLKKKEIQVITIHNDMTELYNRPTLKSASVYNGDAVPTGTQTSDGT